MTASSHGQDERWAGRGGWKRKGEDQRDGEMENRRQSLVLSMHEARQVQQQ